MTEKGAQEDVKGEGNSGPHGNLTAWGSHLQTGMWLHQFPGATSKITVEKCAILGTEKTVHYPQAPRPFIENLRLKNTERVGNSFPFVFSPHFVYTAKL